MGRFVRMGFEPTAVFGLALAVLLGGVTDLFVSVRPGLSPVGSEALEQAAEVVRKKKRPGDLVLHSPLFGVEEVRALGDLRSRSDLPRPSARAGRAVFVIDREEAPMGGLGRLKERLSVGGSLVVSIYAQESADGTVPRFDLREQLTGTTTHVERPPGHVVSRCDAPRAEGGYACPGQPGWLYAARRRLRIDGALADCVWAHPTAGGLVVFEVPALSPAEAGGRLELELKAAMTDDAVRLTSDGAAVTTRVVQGGRGLGQVVLPNREGWARGRFTVLPGVPLRLEVSAPHDGRRHHCIEARVVEVRKGDGR